MKKKIFTLIISIILLSTSITAFAWFVGKSNVAYVVPTNVNLNIKGYYSYTDSNNVPKKEWTNLSETKTEITIEFDYTINFAFVLTNKSDTDVDFSLRLSDFSSYIFEGFNYSSEVSTETKNKITETNSKFFLYIDKFKINNNDVSSDFKPEKYDPDEIVNYADITLSTDSNYTYSDSTPFLWKYGYNNKLNSEAIKIKQGTSCVIYMTLKNSQNQTSLNEDYPTWLYSYGGNYIKNTKSGYATTSSDEVTLDSTSYTDETVKQYLENYYALEKESLFNKDTGATNPTTLCFDYFEFISDITISSSSTS